MVRKCIICGFTYSAESSVSFHSFPTNEKYKKLWLDACKKTKISNQAKICSRHFNISCFKTWDGNGRRTLKKNAVPVLFLDKKNKYLERIQKHSSCFVVQSHSTLPVSSIENTIEDMAKIEDTVEIEGTIEIQDTTENIMEVQDTIQTQLELGTEIEALSPASFTTTDASNTSPLHENILSDSSNEQEENTEFTSIRNTISVTKNILSYPTRIGDCKEEHFSTPHCAKHCFDLVVKKISEHKKRLDNSRKQIARLKSKIHTLEDLVHKLQNKQLISENAAQILLVYISRIFKI